MRMNIPSPIALPTALLPVVSLSACDEEAVGTLSTPPSSSITADPTDLPKDEPPQGSDATPSATSQADVSVSSNVKVEGEARIVSIQDPKTDNCILEVVNGTEQGGMDAMGAKLVDRFMPHQCEVIGTGQSTVSTRAEASISDEVTAVCNPVLEKYVGSLSKAKKYRMMVLTPSQSSWGQGDHSLVCFVQNRDNTPPNNFIKNSQSVPNEQNGRTRANHGQRGPLPPPHALRILPSLPFRPDGDSPSLRLMSPPGPYPGLFSRLSSRNQEPAENRHDAAIPTVTVRLICTWTTLLILPIAAAVTTGLASCSLFSSQTTTATEDLKVGQRCNTVNKNSGGDQATDEVVVVDCPKAHTYEVIAQTAFSDDIKDFSKQQVRDSLGQDFCLGEDLTKYVGIESGKTSYQVEYLTSGEGTWAQGDRKITRVVTQGDKSQVKGSAKNSKKQPSSQEPSLQAVVVTLKP